MPNTCKLNLKTLVTLFSLVVLYTNCAWGNLALENKVYGITDPVILSNVTKALDSQTKHTKHPTTDDINNLHQEAFKVIQNAVQPFGYFTPTIRSKLNRKNSRFYARYSVNLGTPVRVRSIDVQIIGPGQHNKDLVKLLQHFPIHNGEILNTEN